MRNLALGAVIVLNGSAMAAQAQDTAAESPIVGTYGVWQLVCQTIKAEGQSDGRICFLSQDRKQADTGQRVVLINIFAAEENKKVMRLTLPFGLELQAGVSLELDAENKVSGKFSTCLPSGCLVPFTFNASAFQTFAGYDGASVQALRVESNQKIVINFDLEGLSEAAVALEAEVAKTKK